MSVLVLDAGNIRGRKTPVESTGVLLGVSHVISSYVK